MSLVANYVSFFIVLELKNPFIEEPPITGSFETDISTSCVIEGAGKTSDSGIVYVVCLSYDMTHGRS